MKRKWKRLQASSASKARAFQGESLLEKDYNTHGYCAMSRRPALPALHSPRLLLALLLLLLLQPSLLRVECISLSSNAKERRKWRDKEVLDFIKKTSVGCPVEYIVGRSDPSKPPKGVRAHLINPSRAEEAFFDKLPTTLTLANRNLSYHAAVNKYTHNLWGNWKNLRWAIPNNHPGQDRKMCINMTLAAASGRVISFYEGYRKMQRGFYVMNAVNALIHPSGVAMLSCGHILDTEGCETRRTAQWTRWVDSCRSSLSAKNVSWSSLFAQSPTHTSLALLDKCLDATTTLGLGVKAPLQRFSKVFVIPAQWDFNYYHFLLESVTRLAHSLPFLRKHPDVLIHLREVEDYELSWANRTANKDEAKRMRSSLLQMLGISPTRLISGPVLADILFLPRSTRCSYALSHIHTVQVLGRELVMSAYHRLIDERRWAEKDSFRLSMESTQRSLIPSLATLKTEREALKEAWMDPRQRAALLSSKLLIIQQRYFNESRSRCWSNATTRSVQEVFSRLFPTHDVVVFSSLSPRPMEEEFYLYSKADILVGQHGAGLANMLAMPSNSLIVEFFGAFVDVNMPVCGYYGPLAAAMGHHHFLHSYDWRDGEIPALEDVVRRARQFYDNTRLENRRTASPTVYKVSPRLHP